MKREEKVDEKEEDEEEEMEENDAEEYTIGRSEAEDASSGGLI